MIYSETDAVQWLNTWERQINERDYSGASLLFDADVLAYGTLAGQLRGIDDLIQNQWQKVWPLITDFKFDQPEFQNFNGGFILIVSGWSSNHHKQRSIQHVRSGRATLVLKPVTSGLRCVHSHLSMLPGTQALL